MNYHRIKHERYNLLIDNKMAGDGSLNYEYDEKGELTKIVVQLIPYPSPFSELENTAIDKKWHDKTELSRLSTTSADALMSLLKTMVSSSVLAAHGVQFELRRQVMELGFDKQGGHFAYDLICEFAAFAPETRFMPGTIAQATDQSKVLYFTSDVNRGNVIDSVKANV
jgi:hypothetical protein